MVESIRFHLDENANNAIADGLRRRGIDVTIDELNEYLKAQIPDFFCKFANLFCLSRKSRGSQSPTTKLNFTF
ncbi:MULTISPECIES: hypothetical protein [Pseudanabaena]|uniref:hypothetical protein n=1 Tax=Pseudanabaena TaxID=1152 RepID=UPI00247AA812|nr:MULTISPECIES: hypothetical protein [Pseudanabaena]MEA5486698.1 hypothetical protein [Pseudanabaena sp. CCNP1317]WGS73521.1 hypothetical protein OA858_05690 [Pseudanabaena galeata CCNP1313]